jgi:hypothetical protein
MELGDRRLCQLKAVEYTTAATKKAAHEKSLTLMMLSPARLGHEMAAISPRRRSRAKRTPPSILACDAGDEKRNGKRALDHTQSLPLGELAALFLVKSMVASLPIRRHLQDQG